MVPPETGKQIVERGAELFYLRGEKSVSITCGNTAGPKVRPRKVPGSPPIEVSLAVAGSWNNLAIGI